MPRDVVHEIVEGTGEVAYRYRLWPTRGYEYISESVRELLGYSADELYSDPLLPAKIIHPDDAELMTSVLDEHAGSEHDLELRWIRPDGGLVYTDVHLVVRRDASGRAIQVDGVARDVTGRDEARRHRLALVQARGRASEPGAQTRVARVVVVDDHELTRLALRMVVAEDPAIELVGEAANGTDAVALIRRLQPDLVLMDVRMPDLNGLEVTRIVKASAPMCAVLILTMFEDLDLLLEAIKAGAAGYVLKSADEAAIRTAIWEALRGGLPVDPQLARDVLLRLANEQTPRSLQALSPDPLSPREHEVLQLLARGLSNREIADALIITSHTVKIHVEHILAKLGVSDRTQAAVRAIELGFISAGV
jgi:PAS domain S-box-containing protein